MRGQWSEKGTERRISSFPCRAFKRAAVGRGQRKIAGTSPEWRTWHGQAMLQGARASCPAVLLPGTPACPARQGFSGTSGEAGWSRQPEDTSWSPWASHWTFFSFHFLICKTGSAKSHLFFRADVDWRWLPGLLT